MDVWSSSYDFLRSLGRKDQRGEVGSKQYTYAQKDATKGLDPPFGVAKHFVSSLDGETEDGNQTKNM